MRNFQTLAAATAAVGLLSGAAAAQEFTLRAQTHHSAESLPGRMFEQWVEDVETMSNGRIDVEGFWSSAVVNSVETFDAAATGILDCDITGAAYQTGKNPAFQFLGDVMGGYATPYQMIAWLKTGGGRELADELYHQYGMHLVGFWLQGQESLSSTEPLAGPSDLEEWKFRSPPGLETEIFAALGARPVVMDFTEVFTALETGIIDGADASALNTNVSLGLYDIAGHATYPGFHSMPADHVACNLDVWNSLPQELQRVLYVATDKMALETAVRAEVLNQQAAVQLAEEGITIHDWSAEDRSEFRQFAIENWLRWGEKNEITGRVVQSHIDFMRELGLIEEG